jgi:hypothetical protein
MLRCTASLSPSSRQGIASPNVPLSSEVLSSSSLVRSALTQSPDRKLTKSSCEDGRHPDTPIPSNYSSDLKRSSILGALPLEMDSFCVPSLDDAIDFARSADVKPNLPPSLPLLPHTKQHKAIVVPKFRKNRTSVDSLVKILTRVRQSIESKDRATSQQDALTLSGLDPAKENVNPFGEPTERTWDSVRQMMQSTPALVTPAVLGLILRHDPPVVLVDYMLQVNPRVANAPPFGPSPLQLAVQYGCSAQVIQTIRTAGPPVSDGSKIVDDARVESGIRHSPTLNPDDACSTSSEGDVVTVASGEVRIASTNPPEGTGNADLSTTFQGSVGKGERREVTTLSLSPIARTDHDEMLQHSSTISGSSHDLVLACLPAEPSLVSPASRSSRSSLMQDLAESNSSQLRTPAALSDVPRPIKKSGNTSPVVVSPNKHLAHDVSTLPKPKPVDYKKPCASAFPLLRPISSFIFSDFDVGVSHLCGRVEIPDNPTTTAIEAGDGGTPFGSSISRGCTIANRDELTNVKKLCSALIKSHRQLARQFHVNRVQQQHQLIQVKKQVNAQGGHVSVPGLVASSCSSSSSTSSSKANSERERSLLEEIDRRQARHFRVQLVALDMKEKAMRGHVNRTETRLRSDLLDILANHQYPKQIESILSRLDKLERVYAPSYTDSREYSAVTRVFPTRDVSIFEAQPGNGSFLSPVSASFENAASPIYKRPDPTCRSPVTVIDRLQNVESGRPLFHLNDRPSTNSSFGTARTVLRHFNDDDTQSLLTEEESPPPGTCATALGLTSPKTKYRRTALNEKKRESRRRKKKENMYSWSRIARQWLLGD